MLPEAQMSKNFVAIEPNKTKTFSIYPWFKGQLGGLKTKGAFLYGILLLLQNIGKQFENDLH